MKTISKISLAASFCLLGMSANAQLINDFYHITGMFADHGQGDRVIKTSVSEVNPNAAYVVAGATMGSSAPMLPSVSLSQYDLDGSPQWHKTFFLNTPASANTVAVKGLVEATKVPGSGYGLLAYTNSAPEQSILIRTNAAGVMLWKAELGRQQASALSYDSDKDRFLVATRMNSGAAGDLQLIVVDAKTGSIIFTRTFDGYRKSADLAASVLYDPATKDYLLIGTAQTKTIVGIETGLIVSRVSNANVFNYTHLIGYPSIALSAVDATLIPNGFNSQIAILGTVTGVLSGNNYNKQPSYTLVDVRTGSMADVQVLRKNFAPMAISYVNTASSLAIVGNRSVFAGNEANLYTVDPTDPTLLGQINLYNKPFSYFSFNGLNSTSDGSLVATGSHRFFLPWSGSPANLNYNWLITADAQGNGKCSTNDTLSAFTFEVPVLASKTTSTEFQRAKANVEQLDQDEASIDACDLGFRLAKVQPAANKSGFRFFPNPASDLLNVEYSVAENDNASLLILDMTGRIILNQKLVNGEHLSTSISVADMASGVYYTDLQVNGQSVAKNKLVVQH
jgi:hypothetical protein